MNRDKVIIIFYYNNDYNCDSNNIIIMIIIKIIIVIIIMVLVINNNNNNKIITIMKIIIIVVVMVVIKIIMVMIVIIEIIVIIIVVIIKNQDDLGIMCFSILIIFLFNLTTKQKKIIFSYNCFCPFSSWISVIPFYVISPLILIFHVFFLIDPYYLNFLFFLIPLKKNLLVLDFTFQSRFMVY